MYEVMPAVDNQEQVMSFERGTVAAEMDRPLPAALKPQPEEEHAEPQRERSHSNEYHLNGLVRDYDFQGNPDPKTLIQGLKHFVQGVGHAVTDGAHHGGAALKGEPFATHILTE